MKNWILILMFGVFTATMFAQNSEDQKSIEKLVKTMQQGWDSADGDLFASAFADVHDFIVWNGYYFKNLSRSGNGMAHQNIFDTFYKDTRLYYTIDKMKFIREDVVLIHVLGAVVNKEEERPENPQVLFTGIVEKVNGIWQFVSFHNLDLEIYQDEGIKNQAPIPPSVMYGSWFTEASK